MERTRLKNIRKIKLFGDKTFVLSEGVIFIFDSNGDYITDVGTIADNQNNVRFTFLEDFTLDRNGDIITITNVAFANLLPDASTDELSDTVTENKLTVINDLKTLFFVTKLSQDGSVIWNKQLEIPYNIYNQNFSIAPILKARAISNIGQVIAVFDMLLVIDYDGNLIRSKKFKNTREQNHPLVITSFITSEDLIAVIINNEEVFILDSELETIKQLRVPIFFDLIEPPLLRIANDHLFISVNKEIQVDAVDQNYNELNVFKVAIFDENVIYSPKAYRNLSTGVFSNTYIEGNSDFFYAFGYSDGKGYPVLHKINNDLEVVWSKILDQRVNGVPGTFSAFYVDGGCMVFSMDGIITSDTNVTSLPSGWLIKTDQDISEVISDCITIKDTLSPNIRNIDERLGYSRINILEDNLSDLVFEDEPLQLASDVVSNVEVLPMCPQVVKTKYSQSPFIYLQSAGSTGEDGSTEGVHLRWVFKHHLGDLHLPKGNLATTQANFNKPDDFVKIYRMPYEKIEVTLDFNQAPKSIYQKRIAPKRTKWVWQYDIDGSRFSVYFQNTTRYNEIRRQVNPLSNPLGFINTYGSNIIEIESEYSFAFSVKFTLQNTLPTSKLFTEYVSREENLSGANNGLIARKTFEGDALNNAKLIAEDIRSVRFISSSATVSLITFELYSLVNKKASENNLWEEIGQFSLSNDDTTVFNALENTENLVDGSWPRYNGGDCVNTQNYKDKWNAAPADEFDKSLKQIVDDYVSLSDNGMNPLANERITFLENDTNTEDEVEVSNLNMLFLASMDYHMARMLGLGYLDTNVALDGSKYFYKVEYTTLKKLDNYNYSDSNYELLHQYITIPTGQNDEKLPIPFHLDQIKYGVPTHAGQTLESDENNNEVFSSEFALSETNGYSNTGNSRFISIFAKDVKDYKYSRSFYISNEEFNSSEFTVPVNGSIDYKRNDLDNIINIETWAPTVGDSWDKPELSFTEEYYNKVKSGDPTFETVPLGIPQQNAPLYIHRQSEDGQYIYSTYGINWFGRTSPSTEYLDVITEFVPENHLLPPINVNALHIVEERPLLLTSLSEQQLLNDIPDNKADKTLVRLTFEYDFNQDTISRKVTTNEEIQAKEKFKDIVTDGSDVLLHSEAIFPDEKEIFADTLELYFRETIPRNIIGALTSVTDHPTEDTLAVVTTGRYNVNSANDPNAPEEDNEYVTPMLPSDTNANNFIGSILVVNSENFVIQNISNDTINPTITVFKNKANELQNAEENSLSSDNLVGPKIIDGGHFMAIENMADPISWHTPNPNATFTINLGLGDTSKIHREIIERSGEESPDSGIEKTLEKSRGFWNLATITPFLQPLQIAEQIEDENGDLVDHFDSVHQGVYKVELPYSIDKHPQHTPDSHGNFVNWNGGSLRIHLADTPKAPRKSLSILKIANIGSNDHNTILYVKDEDFQITHQKDGDNVLINAITGEPLLEVIPPTSEKLIQTGENVEINFYLGYKVYLYADPNWNFTTNSISPVDEDVKYSIFGLRSVDIDGENRYSKEYRSKVSPPAIMFVHRYVEPLQPEKPIGALYATRPDSYGKATYTLTTKFKHKPYSTLYYRANNRAILNAIYTQETLDKILEDLEGLKPDAYEANRWQSLLSFNYNNYTNNADTNGLFEIYPKLTSGYRFPLPDKASFFNNLNNDIVAYNKETGSNLSTISIEDNKLLTYIVIPEIGQDEPERTLADYVKQAILNAFIPLTEVPLIYNQIKGDQYQPIPKKQNIRNRNGELLSPSDSSYDISPMAKRIRFSEDGANSPERILFTDFTLDGTAIDTYFYSVREIGTSMKMGDFSTPVGPIKLVNTKAPESPQVKSITPLFGEDIFLPKEIPLSFVDIENALILEDSITNTASTRWKSGVASYQLLKGSGHFTFSVEENTSLMIGLSYFNTNSNYDTIDYAIYFKADGKLEIYHKGLSITKLGSYIKEDIFKIELSGNTIHYFKGEELLFISNIESINPLLIDIALDSPSAKINNLRLFSTAKILGKELYNGEEITVSYNNPKGVNIEENLISKIPDLVNGDNWDAGAESNEYLPFYGSISFKALANKRITVGLAEVKQQVDYTENIAYAILCDEDGFLNICIDGDHIKRCVTYNEHSVISIERRNDILVFKKDSRPFYQIKLTSNIPLLLDFSMFTGDSQIIDLKMFTTTSLEHEAIEESIKTPSLKLVVNAYDKDQRIQKLKLYRTTIPDNTLSIRKMDLVDTIDLVLSNQKNNATWCAFDDFSDLGYIPYSEPLYYKLVVSREIEYAKPRKTPNDPTIIISELKDSEPSRLLVSSIVESNSPETPKVTYNIDTFDTNDGIVDNIILKWNKTVHNGKYRVFKMNTQGNWQKIKEIQTNESQIQLLLEDTDLQTGLLQIKDSDDQNVYHHFKIDAENSIGMTNTTETVITIYNEQNIADSEGIGNMIIENTNLIR